MFSTQLIAVVCRHGRGRLCTEASASAYTTVWRKNKKKALNEQEQKKKNFHWASCASDIEWSSYFGNIAFRSIKLQYTIFSFYRKGAHTHMKCKRIVQCAAHWASRKEAVMCVLFIHIGICFRCVCVQWVKPIWTLFLFTRRLYAYNLVPLHERARVERLFFSLLHLTNDARSTVCLCARVCLDISIMAKCFWRQRHSHTQSLYKNSVLMVLFFFGAPLFFLENQFCHCLL